MTRIDNAAKIAPIQVVIVPIYKGDESKPVIDGKVKEIIKNLKALGISGEI
jgi:prolyl-tRNA synthetase